MRVTALIRRMLALGLLEQQIPGELRSLKQQLQEHDIAILQRTPQPLDILIHYRWKGRIYKVTFMRSMLDAEVQGLLGQLSPYPGEQGT